MESSTSTSTSVCREHEVGPFAKPLLCFIFADGFHEIYTPLNPLLLVYSSKSTGSEIKLKGKRF